MATLVELAKAAPVDPNMRRLRPLPIFPNSTPLAADDPPDLGRTALGKYACDVQYCGLSQTWLVS